MATRCVTPTQEPELGIRRDDKGIHSLGRLEDGERVRVVVREQYAGQAGEPTLRDLSEALIAVWGTDYGSAQRHLDLQVHRYDPAGRVLPGQTGAAGRRRRTRAFAGARTLAPDPRNAIN